MNSKEDYETWQGKVLIAEDNRVNMLLAKGLVSKVLPQAEILEASDGREAVDAYRKHGPDLVFMDVQMPGMDGYEAAGTIREIEAGGRRVPIIALTAGALKGDREQCLAAGMDDYITKPVTIDAIRDALGTRFDSAAAIDENGKVEAPRKRVAGFLRDQGHDDETITEMLGLLERRIPELLEAMNRALEEDDFHRLSAEAHSLKGIVKTLGEQDLSGRTERLEAAAKDKNADEAGRVFSGLKTDLENLKSQLGENGE